MPAFFDLLFAKKNIVPEILAEGFTHATMFSISKPDMSSAHSLPVCDTL